MMICQANFFWAAKHEIRKNDFKKFELQLKGCLDAFNKISAGVNNHSTRN